MEKIVEIGGFMRLECFVSDWENFVVNALIDFLSQCNDSRTVKIRVNLEVLETRQSKEWIEDDQVEREED